jgi:uncharacterized membrane protein YccC
MSLVTVKRSTWLSELEPNLTSAVRAVVAVVPPYVAAVALAEPALTLVALGSWFGMLADPGGARRVRLVHASAFTFVASSVFRLGLQCRNGTLPAVLLLGSVALSSGIVRAIDASFGTLATLFVVVAAIALELPTKAPWLSTLCFAGGVVWATLLTSAVWPIRRHAPMRRVLATTYGALAEHTFALSNAVRGRVAVSELAARSLPRRTRASLEQSRKVTFDERRNSEGESPVGSNLRALLGIADAVLPLLVALAARVEALSPSERLRTGRVLRTAAVRFERTRRALLSGRNRFAVEAQKPRKGWASLDVPLDADLAGRIREGATAAARTSHALEARDPSVIVARLEVPAPSVSLSTRVEQIRSALSLDSPHVRHGLRLGLAAVVATVVGRTLSPGHAAWVTVTAIVVLQPYLGAAWQRAGERIVGTVLGCALAEAVMLGVRSSFATSLLMIPLVGLAMAVRTRNYRLFTFFLTPVFVLLARHAQHDWRISLERVVDATIGGGIALVIALTVFPAREERRLPSTLGTLFDELRAYAELVLETSEAPSAGARRRVALACEEAESSLERMMIEPGKKAADAAVYVQLVTCSRRLLGGLVAFSVTPSGSAEDRAKVSGYVRDVAERASRFARESVRVDAVPERPDIDEHETSLLAAVVRDAAILAAVTRTPGETSELRSPSSDA